MLYINLWLCTGNSWQKNTKTYFSHAIAINDYKHRSWSAILPTSTFFNLVLDATVMKVNTQRCNRCCGYDQKSTSGQEFRPHKKCVTTLTGICRPHKKCVTTLTGICVTSPIVEGMCVDRAMEISPIHSEKNILFRMNAKGNILMPFNVSNIYVPWFFSCLSGNFQTILNHWTHSNLVHQHSWTLWERTLALEEYYALQVGNWNCNWLCTWLVKCRTLCSYSQ